MIFLLVFFYKVFCDWAVIISKTIICIKNGYGGKIILKILNKLIMVIMEKQNGVEFEALISNLKEAAFLTYFYLSKPVLHLN
jgi:hypothetical protein